MTQLDSELVLLLSIPLVYICLFVIDHQVTVRDPADY